MQLRLASNSSVSCLADTTDSHHPACLKDSLWKDQVSNQKLVLHTIYILD